MNRLPSLRKTISSSVRKNTQGATSPWLAMGGSRDLLDIELKLGIHEVSRDDMGYWDTPHCREQAIAFGDTMEQYAMKALASPERCRLWERFRADLQAVIRIYTEDPDARVLMMGGVAQGMATVDGDVDLAIFLPNKIASLQQDRSYVHQTLAQIGRNLKRQGFDGFVIKARVPIIQYRPQNEMEALFCLEGSDQTFRFLKARKEHSKTEAEEVAKKLEGKLSCKVSVHRSKETTVFEFPLAADAFSAMFHHPRQYSLYHLEDTSRSSLDDLFAKLHKFGASKNKQPIKKENQATKKNDKSRGGPASIDDILQMAAQGSSHRKLGHRAADNMAYVPYPFAADISISTTPHPYGPRNSELLRRYLSADPKTRVLAMFVKWWSKHSAPVAINNSRQGWITSYCVLVLLVHFLIHTKRLQFIDPQTIDPVLACDTVYPVTTPLSDDDKVTVVRDFLAFLEFYACGFDYSTEVITLVEEGPKLRTESTAKVLSARNTAVVIEDPYEDRSLGHPIDAKMLVEMRASFLAGARSVVEVLREKNDDEVQAHGTNPHVLAVLKARGREMLDWKFDFEERPNDKSCEVCKEFDAEQHGVCGTCEKSLVDAQTPLQFFAKRADVHLPVVGGVSIAEQKKQESALKASQYLQTHHKVT